MATSTPLQICNLTVEPLNLISWQYVEVIWWWHGHCSTVHVLLPLTLDVVSGHFSAHYCTGKVFSTTQTYKRLA